MKWFWVFPVILIVFGVVIVAYGMKFSDKDYVRTKKEGANSYGGAVSDTFLFAIVELVVVLVIDWFVQFMPKWLIKTFIIILGLGFIALGTFLLIVI